MKKFKKFIVVLFVFSLVFVFAGSVSSVVYAQASVNELNDLSYLEPQILNMPAFTKTLRINSRGTEVKNLTTLLAYWEYLPSAKITNRFNGNIRKALMNYQEDNDISKTGTLGIKTRQQINSDLKSLKDDLVGVSEDKTLPQDKQGGTPIETLQNMALNLPACYLKLDPPANIIDGAPVAKNVVANTKRFNFANMTVTAVGCDAKADGLAFNVDGDSNGIINHETALSNLVVYDDLGNQIGTFAKSNIPPFIQNPTYLSLNKMLFPKGITKHLKLFVDIGSVPQKVILSVGIATVENTQTGAIVRIVNNVINTGMFGMYRGPTFAITIQ